MSKRIREIVSFCAIGILGAVLADSGLAHFARAQEPASPAMNPALSRAYALGYEQGAADARSGKESGLALTECERRRQEADDAALAEHTRAQDADTYGHCLREIRDAEAYGSDAVRDVVARCTIGFP